MRTSMSLVLITAALVLSCSTVAAAAAKEASPLKATVTMPQARKIAVAAFPGKIVKEELEKETGGSGLRYSFDIKSTSGTREIGVDAMNGKVLENSIEGSTPD